MQLDDHLFRRESGRMVAALTRLFGVHNLSLAEDVVQDAFCRALEVWKFRGVPDNPSAWLMATAKHRAIDLLRRERTARTFAPELGRLLESEWTLVPLVDELLSAPAIEDDLLRMMFSCCHPQLSEEAQVALVLHILCGFGVGEIAAAFLSAEAAIYKRISRGKAVLARSNRLFDLQDADFVARLSAVHRALYLLFNEGYHSASTEAAVRADLCGEALRLARLLTVHSTTATPATHALVALMCLHAARLPARTDPAGHLSALADQDRTQWDRALIAEGQRWLELAAVGTDVTSYHIEAAIAAVHAVARDIGDTNWGQIIALYDRLLAIRPSPVVALNRAIAVAERDGPARGIAEIEAIRGRETLDRYPFCAAALGELERRRGRTGVAAAYFRDALSLARNPVERQFFEQRLKLCAGAGQVGR
jgi:RNA polymerase sigma-70 factor (ECF subfamily)